MVSVVRDPSRVFADFAIVPATYIVFKGDDGKAYVKNGRTGQIEYTSDDPFNAVQYAVNAVSDGSGRKARVYLADLGVVNVASRLSGRIPDMVILDGYNTVLKPTGSFLPMDFITVFPDGHIKFVDDSGYMHDVSAERGGMFLNFDVRFEEIVTAFDVRQLVGITLTEDNAVVQGPDGRWYWFLDDFTGHSNHDMYCVSAEDPFFTKNVVSHGKVLTRNGFRVSSILRVGDYYYVYGDDRSTTPRKVIAFSTPASQFPYEWSNEVTIFQRPRNDNYDTQGSYEPNVWMEGGLIYMKFWIRDDSGVRRLVIAIASPDKPLQFTPVIWRLEWGTLTIRGMFKLGGKLFSVIEYSTSLWNLGFTPFDYWHYYYYLYKSLYSPANRSVANPNTAVWLYYPYALLVYYDSTDVGAAAVDFHYKMIGRLLILPR